MDRDIMRMDCRTCPVQGVACGGCMVTALLDPDGVGAAGADTGLQVEGPEVLTLDRAERQAVGRLVAAGLVSTATANATRARREPWAIWEELHETG